MTELPVPPKQSENSSVSNGTGEKENPNLHKEKKKTNVDSERSERAKKKRKHINCEALDILSKEAELAVERSQSMDEEHFRNFTQKTKQFTQFSDLIVEPIHSHPSDLIQKFMSDSSSHENDDSNSDEFSPTDNQNCDNLSSDHQSLPENTEVNDHQDSNEESSNLSQFMDKNDPKSFNILSSDNEANLEILNENDMYPHTLSNCLPTDFDTNRDKKSGNDDFNNLPSPSDNPGGNNLASNFVADSNNLGTSPCSNSFESYHSPDSSSPGSSPKDSSNYSPQHIENNTAFLNGYGFGNFTHENGSSTVDASCLGLASANTYKKHQPKSGPKTSVAENFSQATLNYNGNHNSYNVSQEVDGLEHSRSHRTCSSSDNFALLQGQRLPEQEAVDSDLPSLSSQQEVESHDSVKKHKRSSPPISFSQDMQRQISVNDQAMSPTYNMQQDIQTHLSVIQEHCKIQSSSRLPTLLPEVVKSRYTQASSFLPAALKDQDSAESQQRHSLNPSPDETQKQRLAKSLVKNSNISYQNKQVSDQVKFNSHQEVENGENNRSQPMVSATSFANQQLNNQNSQKNYSMYFDQNFSGSQPRYSPTLPAHQEMNHQQPPINQPRYSPTVFAHQEMNHQQPVKKQPRYSPTLSAYQEMNRQQQAQNQPRYSPTASAHQEMNHQQAVQNQPRYSPTLSAHHEMNHQQLDKNQLRYSPTAPAHQEMNHQQAAQNQPRYSPTESMHQEISHQQSAENQPGSPPNATAQQTDDKKSSKIQGNSSFSTSQIIEEQESVRVQSSYSPAFSNQEVLVQESAKSSVQHMHNESPIMQNQVPVEAPPFDFGNIFSNSFSSVNATAQVNEPPFTSNSSVQIPSSHFNQNNMTRPSFPTMKVRLPPSTGELIVVPGDPSSMTFHLLAKPLSDPSQPIQSSVEIHATDQMRNQDRQENSNDKSASARSKNPAKQDTAPAPRKQRSPVLDLQQLAMNPRRSSSPSSQKNKNCGNRSAEPSLKSPPAIASDFTVIKPNAVLVRPLESSATSMQQQQARNGNSFQQGAFVQQTEGPRTVIFSKGNRMPNVLGSSTNSMSAMSINVNNGQRPIIPSSLPNTVIQNSNGQYVLVPSKDILQGNVDPNLKVKNSDRPPQFYPSNMVQSFPFQNGQMNPVQMLPQVNFPYVNPYYIVTNPSAFQNASRYPVMNMQPIPFQNR